MWPGRKISTMNKTNIEWCDYTWNPITGCRRGCSYCYARRIHERFNKTPFSEIIFHPKRMYDLDKLKGGEIVFVGSMSDIEYWNPENTKAILKDCSACPKTTFMFLSKSCFSYRGFLWPPNTMQGLTITHGLFQSGPLRDMGIHRRSFLSIEPLMGIVGDIPSHFEKIIVGAMTGPGAKPPEKKWIQSVINNVPADKIFWKSNINEYL